MDAPMIQRAHELRVLGGPDVFKSLILQLSEFSFGTHARGFQVRRLVEFALARFSDVHKLTLVPFRRLSGIL